MFGSVESFYKSLASNTRKIATKNNKAASILFGSAIAGVGTKATMSFVKAPRTIADRLYPQTTVAMGSGKYGIGAGSSSDLGAAGLKFSFKKKR